MSVPGASNPLLLSSAAGAAGYEIERSLRFNSADSAHLSRTPASAGNRKTWTWVGWVKTTATSGTQALFGTPSGSVEAFDFSGSAFRYYTIGGSGALLTTSAVFRDPSAWLHVVFAVDTTQATNTNRVKLYVNGSQITQFSSSTYPAQNYDTYFNNNNAIYIGDRGTGIQALNAYLADVHFIDGQALDPTSFGEFDDNGVWQPIEYTGTYGTNGFHLPFSDNSSASALGTDDSGNGNDWTVNNISVASGSGNDSLRDSPTNGNTANDTGLGGEVPGNYCTMNPLDADNLTLSNGNLGIAATGGFGIPRAGTVAASSGKWYWEFEVVTATTSLGPGWGFSSTDKSVYALQRADSTNVRSAGCTVNSTNPGNITSGTVGVALDIDAGTATIYHNNSSVATVSGIPAGTYTLAYTADSATDVSNLNAGQRAFTYTAPSGFKALCTANLDTPTIEDGSTVMDAVLYDGNGSTQTISGLNFSPDLVWLKSRSDGDDHSLQDTVRGAGNNRLRTNQTNSENTQSGQISSFNSDGWTMGNRTNESGRTYVGWAWDAGSSTVTNTDGSISSSVRANPTAGFSIVSYTGTGANATVGHGLNAAPEFAIFKVRSTDNNWGVYHKSLGATDQIKLNQTASTSSSASFFQNTEPTSSVIYLGADSTANYGSETMIAYCFAPVEGYSAFGSYTGTQPFIYTGFRPRWIMVRRYDVAASEWVIFDSARSGYNGDNDTLCANRSSSENAFVGSNELDILSNGFKFTVTRAITNGSDNYIYACFAESPFRSARAR